MREYLKKYKRTLLITSVIILLPIVAGLLLWNQLPEKVPFHWNVQGQVDGWASRPMAVFFLPLFMLAMHWFCVLMTGLDPKVKNATASKAMTLVLWIIPVLSLVMAALVYVNALNRRIDVSVLLPLFMGVLWIAIGNYLPKCKQSYTLGIKLPWTLNDEQNWNATHRLTGKLWVAGGVLTVGCALLPPAWAFGVMMGIVVLMCAIPTVYSYRYYNKHKTEE